MRRNPTPSADQGVRLSLIVTPMLDMAFQILAFFIMTYHPSALEAHVPGSLAPNVPATRDKNEPVKLDPDAVDAIMLDELTSAPIIQIKAIVRGQEAGNRTAGMPSQLFLKMPLDVAPRLVADVDLDFEAALKRLDVQLKELLRTGLTKSHIKIAADGELRQLHLMKVYDAARKAGFQNVHFVPPPKLAN